MMKRKGRGKGCRRFKKGGIELKNQKKRSGLIDAEPWGRIKPNVNSDGFSNVF